MKRYSMFLAGLIVAVVCLFGGSAAQARSHSQWFVGVNAAPAPYPAPYYYGYRHYPPPPPPVYYAPRPCSYGYYGFPVSFSFGYWHR